MTSKWYEDRNLLKAAYEQYGTLVGAAEALGGADPTTLSKWWRRHGLNKLPKGPRANTHPVNKEALEELHRSIYGKRESN
jgi:transposase-like protein